MSSQAAIWNQLVRGRSNLFDISGSEAPAARSQILANFLHVIPSLHFRGVEMIELKSVRLIVQSLLRSLRHLDLIEQIGMATQHFDQLDQGQWRLSPAVLIV